MFTPKNSPFLELFKVFLYYIIFYITKVVLQVESNNVVTQFLRP